jgi:hypothetical protein
MGDNTTFTDLHPNNNGSIVLLEQKLGVFVLKRQGEKDIRDRGNDDNNNSNVGT